MLYLEKSDKDYYIDSKYKYNPSVCYPEYPWSVYDISPEPNWIYDMVRNALYGMRYDVENYGTKKWNPLGEIIKPGQKVLLKPNWVSHKNKGFDQDKELTCLVTHPSVVRVLLDYVYIALQGQGEIIIGDAPMQGTDLDQLWEKSGYLDLFSFINQKQIPVKIVDLRKYKCIYKGNTISGLEKVISIFKSKIIELNSKSLHAENDNRELVYKVSDYDYELTRKYHSKYIHKYEVSEAVLVADVIINIPKPKTHRLAGITGAMKNFVGVTYEKASLPHRAIGDKETNKGDAYLNKSIFKKYMDIFDNYQTRSSTKGDVVKSIFFEFVKKLCYGLAIILGNDKYRIGGWYGNDTIWRTVLDLNQIVLYADKNGVLQNNQQRKILNVGDMIICGQKEGPIGPTPKQLGCVLISDNMFVFDYVLSKIMGFDYKKIPSLKYLEENNNEIFNDVIFSNDDRFNKKNISKLCFPNEFYFEPHSCWMNLRIK